MFEATHFSIFDGATWFKGLPLLLQIAKIGKASWESL